MRVKKQTNKKGQSENTDRKAHTPIHVLNTYHNVLFYCAELKGNKEQQK